MRNLCRRTQPPSRSARGATSGVRLVRSNWISPDVSNVLFGDALPCACPVAATNEAQERTNLRKGKIQFARPPDEG